MNLRNSPGRRGFTLVELMTVIAIIVLLIGVLIPALSSARTSARKATTAGLIKSLDSGCEMFRNDFKQYPQSRGPNPFEVASSRILLMGFQWLGLQLVGPDSGGIVDWRDLRNDANDDKAINGLDWLEWYNPNPATRIHPDRTYARLGPYASVDSEAVQSIRTYSNVRANFKPADAPGQLIDGSTVWKNDSIPFFVDSFTNPVLYYRANPQTDKPFTTGQPGSSFVVGQYDQTDNAAVTGSPLVDGYAQFPSGGSLPGWDIDGTGYINAAGYVHDLGNFGYAKDQLTFPQPQTFAEYMCDGKIWDNTVNSSGDGRLWPYHPDSYVLISAGPDGVYGNSDDITNFKTAR
jgi:prepilin-type N-terminal cleavage/methylation domain-containing protein